MRILLFTLLLSTLDNADVVRLVKAGLSPETIEAKIASSETTFDTSTEALVRLTEEGVPDRVIKRMIETRPAPPPAKAKPAPTRRYDVTVHGGNGGKCEGELRVDGKGVKVSRCRALDFEVAWADVKTACYEYGFLGTLVVNGHRITTTTPAEAKRIVEQVQGKVPVGACGRPSS